MTAAPRSGTLLRTIAVLWLGMLAGFAIGIEWIRSRPTPPQPSGGIDLVGAGATFPYPLYRRWFADYGAASGVRINYFSVGSAEGIRLMLDGTADFGASDRPLTSAERDAATCGPVEIPMVVGAVAVAYQLPELGGPLRLDADVIAEIFLGRVSRWNDAALRALNPDLALPDLPILPVQRARTTGTSAVFSRYLEDSPQWVAARRSGRELTAAGSRVEGNEGVTAEIRVRPGSIGIVEYSYAQQAHLPVALLRNLSGAYIAPSPASIAAAAAEILATAGSDSLLGVVGARAAEAYPAVALTRIVADRALDDDTKGAHFVAFARWALSEGAASAADVGYAPLPDALSQRLLARLDQLRPGRCPAPRAQP